MSTTAIFWLLAGLLTALCVLVLLRPLTDSKRIAFALTCIVPLAALGLYLLLGRPELTQWHTRQQLPPFIAASVEKLKQDVEANPTNVQAWVLLGDVYGKVRHYGEAADSYRRAATLDQATPIYKAMVGQALVMQDGGAVGDDALEWFDQAKDDPTSRYYFALEKSEEGDWKAALADWQALMKDAPEPEQTAIAARIEEANQALGLGGHPR